MAEDFAECPAAFRVFNDKRIYRRPASAAQARAVVRLLRALVEYFIEQGQDVREAVT